MNYQNIYDQLILRGQNRNLDGYTERHHIIPKCLGGADDNSNLVDLTPEEHYVAHQLLVKLNPTNNSLIWAANMMTVSTTNQKRNNKVFGWLRRAMAANGRKHSDATKAKIRATKAANPNVLSTETKAKMSQSRLGNQNAKGFKHSVETRAKVSAAGKGLKRSEATKAKMRIKNYTPEQIAVFSLRRKEYWARKKLENIK